MNYKKIIISFNPGAMSYDVDDTIAFAESFGGMYVKELPLVNAIVISVPEDTAKMIIDAMNKAGFVKYAHETVRFQALGWNDSQFQMYNSLSPEVVPWGIEHIKAIQAHEAGFKGQGVKVGVLDTGIDYTHPDLSGNIVAYKNFVTDACSPGESGNDGKDVYCHGTHVSGTIAANGRITSVAPEAKLYSARVLDSNGSGCDADIISGIEWMIQQGVTVVNCSFGGEQSSPALSEAFSKMNNSGVLIVAAAGNAGTKDDPCSQDTIGYPAKFEYVVSVSAIEADNTIAAFSSRGYGIDLAAPGRWVYSTYCKQFGPLKYRSWNGTSMACPHVVGVVALIKSAFPNTLSAELRQKLLNSCYSIGDSNCFGKGVPDAYAAVTGTAPTAPPPKPTETHKTCTSDMGCYPIYGSAIEDECTDMCYRCDDESGVFSTCVMDPNNGTSKTQIECSMAGCSGFAYSTCMSFGGSHRACMPAQPGQAGAIKTRECKQTCEGGTQPTYPTEPTGTYPTYPTEPTGTYPTEPTGTYPTEPTGTQPTGTQPTQPGEDRYHCNTDYSQYGITFCEPMADGEFPDYSSCVASCEGGTQPTYPTEPTGTQPTGTHPTGTQPTGTQPISCGKNSINIFGKCIDKKYVYGGFGAGLLGIIGYAAYKESEK